MSKPIPGDRVELVQTNDPYTRLKPGDQGRVVYVWPDEVGVDWDSGSSLAMIPSQGDVVRRVAP